ASAQTTDGGIEAATAGFIGRDDFGDGLVGAAVQVDSDLKIVVLRHHRGNNFANLFRRRYADGVGEGEDANLFRLEQAHGCYYFVDAPVVAVGIAEGHRNVDDGFEPGFVGFLLDLFQFLDGVFQSLPLIVLQKCWRDRVREPEGADGLGRDRSLRAFFVDHDADDFYVVGRVELF